MNMDLFIPEWALIVQRDWKQWRKSKELKNEVCLSQTITDSVLQERWSVVLANGVNRIYLITAHFRNNELSYYFEDNTNYKYERIHYKSVDLRPVSE